MTLTSEELCRIFYEGSAEFNAYFAYMLGKQFKRKVRAISVEIDYGRQEDTAYMNRKIQSSFKVLNYIM